MLARRSGYISRTAVGLGIQGKGDDADQKRNHQCHAYTPACGHLTYLSQNRHTSLFQVREGGEIRTDRPGSGILGNVG